MEDAREQLGSAKHKKNIRQKDSKAEKWGGWGGIKIKNKITITKETQED